MTTAKYEGACHCGQISYEIEGEIDQVIDCNCTICSKKGYLLWLVPGERLRFKSGEKELASYTFRTHKIEHHFCPRCGCAPFGIGQDPQGHPKVAVNVRCLQGVNPSTLKIISFDGLSL